MKTDEPSAETLELRFVRALLPRLKPETIAAMREDVRAGRMGFGEHAGQWGPPGTSGIL